MEGAVFSYSSYRSPVIEEGGQFALATLGQPTCFVLFQHVTQLGYIYIFRLWIVKAHSIQHL